MRLTIFGALLLALASSSLLASANSLTVSISEKSLLFRWAPSTTGRMEIRELPLHTGGKLPLESTALWRGEAIAGSAEVPRFDGVRDRLYAKFQLTDAAAHTHIGEPQHVTDFTRIAAREHSLKRPAGKKGLACVVDDDDLIATGAQHANQNIDIGGLLDWSNPDPALTFECEGRKVGLRQEGVTALDRDIKTRSERGVCITGILLNYVRKDAAPGSPLVHPLTPPKSVPMGPAAFNTARPRASSSIAPSSSGSSSVTPGPMKNTVV